jgi:hypothetical protein
MLQINKEVKKRGVKRSATPQGLLGGGHFRATQGFRYYGEPQTIQASPLQE